MGHITRTELEATVLREAKRSAGIRA